MTTPEPSYRTIQLTQGQVALVSAHRFEELNAFKWFAAWRNSTKSFYAMRHDRLSSGKSVLLSMHREILGLGFGDKRRGDHENHKTLDNRDGNLRIATPSQSNCNRGIYANNVSGFKGVWWHKKNKIWRAGIRLNGKSVHLGCFASPEIAHAVYCEAAKRLHGAFASME